MLKTIMVVEDESIVAKNIQTRLKQLGYTVPATFSSGEEALDNIEDIKPNLVLMDIVLDGKMDGLETAEIIHAKYKIPIVYLTAYADDDTVERAKKSVPYGYLVKPFEITELKSAIEIALNSHSKQKEMIEKSERLEQSFNAISASILVIDSEGIINYANTQSELAFGVTNRSLIGHGLDQFIKIPEYLNIKDFLIENQHIHTHILNKTVNNILACINSNPIRNEMKNAIGSFIRINIANDKYPDPCTKINNDNYYHTTPDEPITIGILAYPKLEIAGIKNIIGNTKDLDIVFEETEFNNIGERIRRYNPEIICVGDRVDGLDLSKLMETINSHKLKTNVILLMSKFDQNSLINALSSGIKGCLSNDSESIKLIEAIKTVHNGNIWLEAETLNNILPKLLLTTKKRKHALNNHNLTNREEEIARLIMKGYSNRNIAKKLFITEKTVKTHLTKIFKKLGINNRLELAVKYNAS